MSDALILLAPALPIAVGLGVISLPAFRPIFLGLAPLAAAVAVLVALLAVPGSRIDVPWLLLDTAFGIDVTTRVILLFTGILWTIAAVYARGYHRNDPHPHRFFFFLLLAMGGNFGLIVAQDVVTFYAFFGLMTFSSYGLVVHDETPFAFRAGVVYIVLAVAGEFMLLVGILLAVQEAGTLALAEIPAAVAAADAPERTAITATLLLGFGIKAGMIPLHVWLPLAHPAAPTAASAVLSGAMIKAGLLGWLRFLPLGETDLHTWGTAVVVLALAASFGGAAVGIAQSNPKITLAYSSISQMGLMTIAVGAALLEPAAWPAAQAAVVVYALHHGLAKATLFLGVGLAHARLTSRLQGPLLQAGLLLAALALAGAPLTGGLLAKTALKEATALAPGAWPDLLDWLLPLAAAGTTLVLLRYLVLIRRELAHVAANTDSEPAPPAMWVSWIVLAVCSLGLTWVVPSAFDLDVTTGVSLLTAGTLWTATWPVLLAAVIAAGVLSLRRAARSREEPEIPAGDLIVVVEWGALKGAAGFRRRAAIVHRVGTFALARWSHLSAPFSRAALARAEEIWLTRWSLVGCALLVLALGLGFLLAA